MRLRFGEAIGLWEVADNVFFNIVGGMESAIIPP